MSLQEEAQDPFIPEWKRSLIRAEFIKLYFDSFGVKDTLEISRFTELFNFHKNQNQDKEKLLFAIVKVNNKSDLFPQSQNEIRKKLCESLSLNIMFPKKTDMTYDSSVDFLELCFSGLYNQTQEQLTIPDGSEIGKFFKRFDQKASEIKDKTNFSQMDQIFKNDIPLRKKHLSIVNDVFGNELDKIQNNFNDDDVSYSLFIAIEGQLIEYVSRKNLLHIVPEEITEANVCEKIQNYITKQNKMALTQDDASKREPLYLDDIVLFRECLQKQKEETISTNIGEFIIILCLSIFFIVNFMLVIPESIFYDKKIYMEHLFNLNERGTVTNVDTLKVFIDKYFIDKIFSPGNKFTYKESIDQNNPTYTPDSEDSVEEQNARGTYKYLDSNNVFSGMALNFALKDKTDPEKLYATKSNYYGHYAKHKRINGSINKLISNTEQLYIAPNELISEKENIKKKAVEYFTEDLAECTITLMIFNSDYDITIIDSLTFTFEPFGKVEFVREFQGFRSFLNKGSIYISLLVLNIFYLITLVYDTYRVVNLCTNRLIDYFKFHVNTFEFADIVDIVIFILVLSSSLWFYVTILFKSSVFPIICDENAFVEWIEWGFEVRQYQDFTAFVILLVIFKLIRFIYNSFPALGIVFDTFSLAIRELLSLFFLCFIMIIGLFFLFQSIIGGYSLSYKSLGNAFISCYLLFLGIFDYAKDYQYQSQEHPITPYLWIIFYILFQLILCNIFLCLIHSTFKDVKEKKQMFNDAVFQMSSDSFMNLYERLCNLILFKAPEESKPQREVIAIEENKDKNEAEENNTEPKKKQVSLVKILKYNLSNLQIESLFKKNILNLEEFEQKKKESYYRIRKDIMREYVEELQSNTSKDFNILFDAILYLIYAIIHIIVVYYQLRLGEMKDARDYALNFLVQRGRLNNFIKGNPNFNDLNKDILTFIHKLYEDKNNPLDVDFKEEEMERTFDTKIAPYYTFYGTPYIRVTFRQYAFVSSLDDYKKKVFDLVTPQGSGFLDSSMCPHPYERTSDYSDDSEKIDIVKGANIDGSLIFDEPRKNPNEGIIFRYEKANSNSTIDNCGGYIINFSHNLNNVKRNDKIYYLKEYIDYMSLSKANNLGSMVVDLFLFSNNRDFLIYSRIEILKSTSGVIKPTFILSLVPFNKYITINDFGRTVCEIVYYIFFLIFFFKDASAIWKILRKKLYQNYLDSHTQEIFKDSPLINKYYRFTLTSFKNDKGIVLVIKIFFITLIKFITKTLLFFYYLILSLLKFIFDSIFHFLDLLSIVITIALIAIWFYIISITYSIHNNNIFSDDYDIKNPNLVKVNHLYHLYSSYTCWQAINIFVIFLTLIQYLKFSRPVYMPFLVFQRSKLTIALYLIFIFIVNLGFVFFGYALFSENLITFKTIGSGLLDLFVILAGKIRQQDTMDLNDDVWRPIFLFFFLTFNCLVLLNFFFSILLESYNEIKDRQAKNFGKATSLDFVTNIYTILTGKMDNFIEVCNRYNTRVEIVFKDYREKKEKQAKEILTSNEDSKKSKNRKCCGNCLLSIDIQRKFFQIIRDLSYKCLIEDDEAYNANAINGNDLVNMDGIGTIADAVGTVAVKPNNHQRIDKSRSPNSLKKQVTIYHKIIIYLISVSNVSFPLPKKPKDAQFFLRVKDVKTQNFGPEQSHKSYSHSEEEIGNKWDNEFFQEFNHLINHKANSFFKKNIFEKYYYQMGNPLTSMYSNRVVDTSVFNPDRISRLSKETLLTKMDILFQSDLFMTPSILSKQHSNVHKQVLCLNQCQIRRAMPGTTSPDVDGEEMQGQGINQQPGINEALEVNNSNGPRITVAPNPYAHINLNAESTMCEECKLSLDIFDSYSATIYDIMIKYFYLPQFSNFDDRDLYLGYYVYEMNKDTQNNNQSKNLSKEIPNHKIKLFINDIRSIWKIENLNKIDITIFEKEKIMIEKEKKTTKFYDNLPVDKLRLYFYYNIWSVIYTLLFSDNQEEVKRIRNLSLSYKLLCKYREDKKKRIKESLFNYLFTELNGLKSRELDSSDMQKYNLSKDYDFCEALRYVMRNERLNDQKQLNSDDFDKIFLFYSDSERLLINLKNPKEEMILKERDKNCHDIFRFDLYPQIFPILWKDWKSSILYKLFFGYNTLLDSNKESFDIIKEMKSSSFLMNQAKNLDVYEYFTPENRAEVVTMFLPPAKFVEEALKLIRKFYDDKQESEMLIEKIQSFSEILNHFKDFHINLLVKHQYFTLVFEATLSEIKRGLLRINDDYNFHYHQFLRYNNEIMNPLQKIAVGKFYTHAKEKERFDFLCDLCKNELKKNEMAKFQSKRDYDEEVIPEKLYQNVDELNQYALSDEKELKRKKLEYVTDESYRELYKTNPFIWILSLDPFDYLNVCQKIRDEDIREFYLEIYIFIYGEDHNKENYFLKRKIKMNFIEKYDAYLQFVKKREEVEKKRDLLIQKEKALNDAISYLEARKNQYELLYSNWDKEKKQLNENVINQTKKERKDINTPEND